MDYEARIATVEVLVDTLRKELDRLHQAIEQLRQHTDERFSEVWNVLAALRQEVALVGEKVTELRRELAAQREHSEQQWTELRQELAAQRAYSDQKWAELRQDLAAQRDHSDKVAAEMMRWQQRQTIAIAIMIAGFVAKLLGLY